MKILVLGAAGMLGHIILFELLENNLDAYGTVRNKEIIKDKFPKKYLERIKENIDVFDIDKIEDIIDELKPNTVINCIGIIKQRDEGKLILPCIEVNAKFPHVLYNLCNKKNIRLIHYSTSSIFNGKKETPYKEDDLCSAENIYGITKYLGEINEKNAITIRTSIIGHELYNKLSLLEWFLAQSGSIYGYSRAIFTGLTTCEQSKILINHILPNKQLNGLYNVAAEPISKYDLLNLIAKIYSKNIQINKCEELDEKMVLSAEKFNRISGYKPPKWETLIVNMKNKQEEFLQLINQ